MSERSRLSRLSNWIMTACSIWLVALGEYFIVLRPPQLPEDPRFMGRATLAQLREVAPGLEARLRIVFTIRGGYMVGAGVLTLGLEASTGLRCCGGFRGLPRLSGWRACRPWC